MYFKKMFVIFYRVLKCTMKIYFLLLVTIKKIFLQVSICSYLPLVEMLDKGHGFTVSTFYLLQAPVCRSGTSCMDKVSWKPTDSK